MKISCQSCGKKDHDLIECNLFSCFNNDRNIIISKHINQNKSIRHYFKRKLKKNPHSLSRIKLYSEHAHGYRLKEKPIKQNQILRIGSNDDYFVHIPPLLTINEVVTNVSNLNNKMKSFQKIEKSILEESKEFEEEIESRNNEVDSHIRNNLIKPIIHFKNVKSNFSRKSKKNDSELIEKIENKSEYFFENDSESYESNSIVEENFTQHNLMKFSSKSKRKSSFVKSKYLFSNFETIKNFKFYMPHNNFEKVSKGIKKMGFTFKINIFLKKKEKIKFFFKKIIHKLIRDIKEFKKKKLIIIKPKKIKELKYDRFKKINSYNSSENLFTKISKRKLLKSSSDFDGSN